MRLCSIVPSVIALTVLMLASAGTSNAENAASAMAGTRDEVLLPADQVIVRKGERRLLLLRDGRVMRSYRVSLGLNPNGHKEQEGDFRTPEGTYALTHGGTRTATSSCRYRCPTRTSRMPGVPARMVQDLAATSWCTGFRTSCATRGTGT